MALVSKSAILYQSPMGKVKKSISQKNLSEKVSIPYGKGKATKLKNKNKEIRYQFPMGKVKTYYVY